MGRAGIVWAGVAAVRNQTVALLGAAGFAVRAGFSCTD